MFGIKQRSIAVLIYLIIYKLMLDISYIGFVHKLFEYMGFYLDFNLIKYMVSFIIMISLYIAIPKNQEKPSTIILQLHYIMMIIPMFTIYAFMDESSLFLILIVSMFLLQSILLRILPNIKIIRIKESKKILYVLLGFITVVVYTTMIAINGMPSLAALNDSNVYLIRASISYPFAMTYLVNWQAQVINPFLISIAYLEKKWRLLFFSIFLQFFLYLMTAHKTFLLITIAIIFTMVIISKWDFLIMSSKTAALGTFSLFIFYKITNLILIPSILLRRLLFVPAHIKFSYYDFFSKNEFMYFSLGVIGKVFNIKYPYDINIAYLIGEEYYNSPGTWVNVGYLADAYANMGVFGMFVISILFISILKLIDSLSLTVGKELTIGITLFSILSLNDGSLLTSLLTGGFLFLLCVLYLYSSSKLDKL